VVVMAEFLNQKVPHDQVYIDGLGAMGHPIPDYRKDEAYRTCREDFGMTADKAFGAVQGCAQALERDRPYEAMSQAMKQGIDLTGAYRLMAVLLTYQED
jgi:hypothetical protein